jgi:hypothetical protein
MKTKFSILSTTKIFFMLVVSSLFSCTQEKSISINENSGNRIRLKEYRVINGYTYSIIEVDSVEFITSTNGGFSRITK